VLQADDYTSTCGPVYPGATHLPAKVDRYNTTRGVIGLEEYIAWRAKSDRRRLIRNTGTCARPGSKYHAGNRWPTSSTKSSKPTRGC